ncbi:MAG: protein O-mannosyl-transferase family [Alphaproteobacteria bacterium]
MIRAALQSIQTLPGKDCGKALLLLALLAFHAVFSVFFVAPGHLSIDEGLYHFMARDLISNGSLKVWNGYEEFASPELVLPNLKIHNGTLAAAPPSIFSVLAAPFYWAMGYRGLFLLNALAFVAALGVCFLIAQRLFRDIALSLNACLILTLATFAWQYSQAAWPHSLTMLIVALALYCTIVALQSSRRRDELSIAFLAGLVIGIGVGVRLDTIFALAAVVLAFLFAIPYRLLAALSACLGVLPGLLALAAMNQAKFGLFLPFTYGGASDMYGVGNQNNLLIAGVGLVCGVGAWTATRPAVRRILSSYPWTTMGAALLLGAIVLSVPQAWATLSKIASGAYQLLVDFRIRDLSIQEGGLSRSLGGGMVYLGQFRRPCCKAARISSCWLCP